MRKHSNGISDNTGNPDHVGTVIEVYKESGYMVIEEGNYSNAVKKRTLSINGKFIRGFITPKYDDNTVAAPGLSKGKDIKTIAHEVIVGLWESGENRKKLLTEYDGGSKARGDQRGDLSGENRGAGHRCEPQNAGRGQRVGTGGPGRGLLRRLRRDVLQGQNGGRGGRRQFRRGRCPPSQPRGEKSDPRSFSILNIADLSTDGCFTLGCAVCAMVTLQGDTEVKSYSALA